MKRSSIFLLIALTSGVGSWAAGRPPNFILLLTDDQSYHLGMLGVKGLETPRLDALARQGIFFTKAYSSAASCAPCRGSLLTGMYPSANGHWRNTVGPEDLDAPAKEFGRKASRVDAVGVHEDIPTLIEVLRGNGYFTGITEKWHISPPWKFPYEFREAPHYKLEGSVDAVRNFLKQAGDRPFFLQANVDNTHRPYGRHIKINPDLPKVDPASVEVPPHWPDTPKTRQDYADYLTTVQHVDAIIGAILQEVAAAGQLENTILIYTSDQGFCYHRAKATAYDWGVHVPFAVAGPGIKGGRISDALVGHVDVMPTILDYAGIAVPATVQGKSLRPVLAGTATDVGRTFIVSEHNAHGGNPDEYYPTRSLTDGRYRFVWNLAYKTVPDFDIDTMADPEWRKVSHQLAWMPWDATPSDVWENNACEEIILNKDIFPEAYRLLKESMFRPEFELYDLKNDPYETKNLAGSPEHEAVVRRLDQTLKQWMQAEGDIGDPRSIRRRTK